MSTFYVNIKYVYFLREAAKKVLNDRAIKANPHPHHKLNGRWNVGKKLTKKLFFP